MKQVFFLIAILLSLQGFAQHPIATDSFALQTLGNSQTLIRSKGAIGSDSGFVNARFADTTAANRGHIKSYPGAQIRVGNDIWYRNSVATQWIKFSSSGNSPPPSIVRIIDSTHISICNVNSCDTFTTSVTPNYVTITSDTTLQVCNNTGSCQTINFSQRPIIPSGNFVDTVFSKPNTLTDTLFQGKNGVNSIVKIYDRNCGLINGGIVTYDSLLIFTVSSAVYILCSDGVRRTSPTTNVTLATADGTFDRFDAIILDSSGVNKITGVPSATPALPGILPSQILLAYINVPATATSIPACSTPDKTIYDENTGSPEWATSASGFSVDFSSVLAPYHLTKSANVPSFTAGKTITFASPSNVTIRSYSSLKFFIRLKATFANNTSLQVSWVTSAGLSTVNLLNGTYGFSRTIINAYQTITIPISAFTSPSPAIETQLSSASSVSLRFTTVGTNGSGFYIDYIQIGGSCIGQPPPATFTELDPLSVHNQTNVQANSNFNIDGAGVIGTTLKVGSVALDNTELNLLVWNATDKILEYRNAYTTLGLFSATDTGLVKRSITATGSQILADTGWILKSSISGAVTVPNTLIPFGDASNLITTDTNFNRISGTVANGGTARLNTTSGEPEYNTEVIINEDNRAGLAIKSYGTGALRAGPTIHWYRYRGTTAAPTAIQLNDVISSQGFRGYDGTAVSYSEAAMIWQAAENWSVGNHGTKMYIEIQRNGHEALAGRYRALNINNTGHIDFTPQQSFTPVRDAVINIDATTAGYGGQFATYVSHSAANIGWLLMAGETTTNEIYVMHYGSAVGGNFPSGVAVANTFNIQSGAGSINPMRLGSNYLYVSSLEGTGNRAVTVDADGKLVAGAGGGGVPINTLLAATGTNTINNANYNQEWQWNTLAGNTALKLSSTSTAAAAGAQKLFLLSLSGANATSSQTTYALDVSNIHTGTSSTNIAGRFASTSGSNNYALIVPDASGNVGIGTSAPNSTTMVEVVNTGSGNGITVTTGDGSYAGISVSNASAGIGLYSQSNTGIAISAFTQGVVGQFQRRDNTSPNTVQPILNIQRRTFGTPANGIGASLDFYVDATGPNTAISNQFIAKWADATYGTRTSQAIITGVTSTATEDWLVLGQSGYVKLRPMTVTEAGALTPAEGMLVMVSNTDGTFTSIGMWDYENGAWHKL